MIVNGEKTVWKAGLTVEGLLKAGNYRTDRVAVEKKRKDCSEEKLCHRRDHGRG